MVGVTGIHGAAVLPFVVENLGDDIDIVLIHVLNMEANHVMDYSKKGRGVNSKQGAQVQVCYNKDR